MIFVSFCSLLLRRISLEDLSIAVCPISTSTLRAFRQWQLYQSLCYAHVKCQQYWGGLSYLDFLMWAMYKREQTPAIPRYYNVGLHEFAVKARKKPTKEGWFHNYTPAFIWLAQVLYHLARVFLCKIAQCLALTRNSLFVSVSQLLFAFLETKKKLLAGLIGGMSSAISIQISLSADCAYSEVECSL